MVAVSTAHRTHFINRSFVKPVIFIATIFAVIATTIGVSHAATPLTGQVIGKSSKCVEVKNNQHTYGTIIQIATCSSTSAAQKWTMAADNTIQSQGWCMDVQSSGTADNTPISLYGCNNSVAQQWRWQLNGTLLNPNSGKCLEIKNGLTTAGNTMWLRTCDGNASQVWTVPTPDAVPAAHAALPSGTRHTPTPTITFDAAAAPDLLPWMNNRLKPILQQWYPVLADKYAYPQYQPYTSFTVKLDNANTGVAYADQNVINVNPTWLRNNLSDAPGALLHESTHVIQATTIGGAHMPGWLVEGMADYTREQVYKDRAPRAAGANETYISGYSMGSNLLNYIQATYSATFIHDMNVASHSGTYTDAIFTQKTGKAAGSLWTTFTGRATTNPMMLTNKAAGRCIDLPYYDTTNGNRVKIQTCNGSDAEKWVMSAVSPGSTNYIISGLPGAKCLDVQYSGTADGTPVWYWDCNAGNPQQWQILANGSLKNTNSGKCLQPVGGIDAEGAMLEIATCNGSIAQQWTLPQ